VRQIATATPREHYYLKNAEGRRLFTLDLGEIQRALLTASWKEDIREAERLMDEADEPFAAAWLRYKGVGWAADVLSQVHDSSLSGLE
jgi:type IV secretion system protein VirB4